MKKCKRKAKCAISTVYVLKIIFLIISVVMWLISLMKLIRRIKYRKLYTTWTGSKMVGDEMYKCSFTLNKNGTFDLREYKDGSINRTRRGKYNIKGKWIILHSKNCGGETLELLIKDDKLYTDGVALSR